MDRVLRYRCFLGCFLLAFCALFAGRAIAATETIAATQSSGSVPAVRWYGKDFTSCTNSVKTTAEACARAYCASSVTLSSTYTYGVGAYLVLSFTNQSCSAQVYPSCPGGSTLTNNAATGPFCSAPVVYTCPSGQGWLLNGSTCSREACTAVQTRYEGVCRESCPAAGKGGIGSEKFFQGDGSAPSALCIGGCQYTKVWTVTVGGGGWSAQSGASTGASCSTTKLGTDGQGAVLPPSAVEGPAAAPASDAIAKCSAKGQGSGTVNGVVVCSGTEGVTTERVETTAKESTPNSGGGGPTSKATTETKTTCIAGTCTTETTTVTDPGDGGAATTSTSKDSVSATAFCVQNPNDAKCQAAKVSDQKKFCDDNPGSVSCQTMGTAPAPEAVVKKSIGQELISAVSMPGDMSCPADISFPYGGVFEWSPICDVLTSLRPLVLALAWLSAGFIVVGGLKSSGG